MKRPIRPDELRLWSMVAATVHPMPGRTVSKAEREALAAQIDHNAPAARIPIPEKPAPKRPPHPWLGPDNIEPRRKHRIAKEREEIGGRIDLHGMDQMQAKSALEGFVLSAWNRGDRAVLVITGKGARGGGVLRRMTPEWLSSPALREVVAGISEAHRNHGGEGALYVALKRRPRG